MRYIIFALALIISTPVYAGGDLQDMGFKVDQAKRRDISRVVHPGVKTWVIDADGNLSVIADRPINPMSLLGAINAFTPPERESKRVGKKADQDITLPDVVGVLREKGIIED